jgi:hypothetical protein
MNDDEITLPPLPPHRLGERWPHHVVWGYKDMVAYARAAVLLDRQQRASLPRWIPCSERMPDDDQRILTACRGGIGFAWVHEERLEQWQEAGITHWMPIPDAPEEAK